MGGRARRAALLLLRLGLALSAARLWAEDGAAASPATTEQERGFFYRIDDGGNPVFTQVLRWESDPNALEFRIIVRDASGAAIIDERMAEARREVNLPPGSYAYKIIVYNLLGQAETETDWIPIEVVKAERPKIVALSPKTIYMDTFEAKVVVVGEKLLEGGTITLVAADGTRYAGTTVDRKGDGEATVVFPDEAYRPGVYAVDAENPGGLSDVAEGALTVRFQRPVDILVSVGYAPLLALYDDWFVEKWSSPFHPLGLCAGFGIFFIKRGWGSLGLELVASGRRMSGGPTEAAFTSDFRLAGSNLMYKIRFSPRLHGVARLGGGISWSRHRFDYDGYTGPDTASADPFARAGLSLQAFLPCKLYGEIGADASWLFLIDHAGLGLSPKLGVGYQLF